MLIISVRTNKVCGKERAMQNEIIPVGDPDDGYVNYECPAASSGDMTGLIPANNSPETISEEYQELYPYLPKG